MSEIEIKKMVAETININLKSLSITLAIGATIGALIVKAFGL